MEYNITLTALSSLLKVLKVHSCFNDFLIDGRTELKVNNSCKMNKIVSIEPRLYYHFGITYGLKSDDNLMSILSENINLVIGIDGLPLTKSFSSMFWPILGYVRYPGKPRMFLIGLYRGREKPCSCNLFKKNLVDELKDLSVNGMEKDFGKTFVLMHFVVVLQQKVLYYVQKVMLDTHLVQDVLLMANKSLTPLVF